MSQLQLNLRLNSRGMLQDLCSVYDSFSFYSPYKKITSPHITKPVTFVIQEYGEINYINYFLYENLFYLSKYTRSIISIKLKLKYITNIPFNIVLLLT